MAVYPMKFVVSTTVSWIPEIDASKIPCEIEESLPTSSVKNDEIWSDEISSWFDWTKFSIYPLKLFNQTGTSKKKAWVCWKINGISHIKNPSPDNKKITYERIRETNSLRPYFIKFCDRPINK